MRTLWLTICVVLSCVGAAFAQETVQIPFAPSFPSMLTIDEVRTLDGDANAATQSQIARARYVLELHDARRATLTLVNVEMTVADEDEDDSLEIAFPHERLVGAPVELAIDASGAGTSVLNSEAVRALLYAGRGDPPLYMQDLRRLASVAAGPLAAMSPCQNTNLRLGHPETREREASIADSEYTSVVMTSKELRSIDRQSGSALVVFRRTQGMRVPDSAPADPLLYQLIIEIECVVDLETGVARSVISQTTGSDGFVLWQELSVHPLPDQ